MPDAEPQRQAPAQSLTVRYLPQALLLVTVFVVFAPVRNHAFLRWDDNVNVYENPLLDPVSAENLHRIWSNGYQALYIPVTYTFLSGEAAIARKEDGTLSPRVFHVGNLLLHAANALLVFALLRLLLNEKWPAWAGATLFAIHPLQAEPVSWVTETRGLLAAYFGLIALWQYLRYAQVHRGNNRGGTTNSRSTRHYVFASAALLMALLSKPSAVAVVPMAMVLDIGVLQRSMVQSLRSTFPWLLVVAGFSIVTKLLQPDVELDFFRELWARPLVAADALAFYLYKFFVPVSLGPEYGRSPDYLLETGNLYWTWLLPVAAAIGCWLLPSRRIAFVALLLFTFALLPVLGLVPFGYQSRSTVADRYAYLAMLGPAFAVACIAARWSTRQMYGSLTAIFLILGWLTHQQVRLWQDNTTLFTHNLSINTRSVPSHTILGQESLGSRNYSQAIEHFREAARYNRQPRDSWNNVGDASRQLARQQSHNSDDQAELMLQALGAYLKALEADPEYARTHDNLGQTYIALGSVERGIEHYRKALDIDPAFVVSHHNLALALLSQGNPTSAIEHLQEAIRLRESSNETPDSTTLIALGVAMVQNGQYQEAIQAYERALEISPDSLEARRQLDSLLRQLGQ